jgi:hypothetical protein
MTEDESTLDAALENDCGLTKDRDGLTHDSVASSQKHGPTEHSLEQVQPKPIQHRQNRPSLRLMFVFAVLTACLFRKGSAESKKLNEKNLSDSFLGYGSEEDFDKLGDEERQKQAHFREVIREGMEGMASELNVEQLVWVAGIHHHSGAGYILDKGRAWIDYPRISRTPR